VIITLYSGNKPARLWSHAFIKIDTPLHASVLSRLLSRKGERLVITATQSVKVLSKSETGVSNYNVLRR